MQTALKVHINVTDNFTPALRDALEKLRRPRAKRGVEPTWRCEYCGNENSTRKCVDCGAPKPMNDIQGEYRPGFQPCKVICADEMSPRFGQKFLEWRPPPPDPDLMPRAHKSVVNSIIRDIFMGKSYR